MCGIVGYFGPLSPKDVIVDGLRRLEYRGYDSAGVAILHEGHFKRVRASGKLAELEAKLKGESFDGHLGIGHTRWATHGPPNERNAHPHVVDGVSIVHNGIIENYQELRKRLAADGAEFTSDTDSELVAHLLARQAKETGDLLLAVQLTIPELAGAYSILAVWEKQPDVLIAFKNGPPLVLGIGRETGGVRELVVASDVQAVVARTQNIVYLEDGEIAYSKAGDWKIFDASGVIAHKTPQKIAWDAAAAEKGGFPHFMLKEIHEQPRAVAAAIAPHIDLAKMQVALTGVGFSARTFSEVSTVDPIDDRSATEVALRKIERIFIVACGTSHYAAMTARYFIESLARVSVETDVASEFRYREPVLPPNSLVITISQSGETADTLAALRLAKQLGALTLSVCNVRASTIDREARGHLYMNSGVEIGVASTKAFVSTLALMNVFAIYLGRLREVLSAERERELIEALLAAPSQMEALLSYDKYFAEAAGRIKTYRGLLYMGRGVNYPIALEGALKLKELAYMHAEGYAAGEMKHGPLALIDERMLIVTVAPHDSYYEKTLSNLEEARARGGKIISIGTGDNVHLRGISEYYLALPKAEWTINPLLEVLPLQLLAYHVASAMGHDVDQPRNLAKSVTVE